MTHFPARIFFFVLNFSFHQCCSTKIKNRTQNPGIRTAESSCCKPSNNKKTGSYFLFPKRACPIQGTLSCCPEATEDGTKTASLGISFSLSLALSQPPSIRKRGRTGEEAGGPSVQLCVYTAPAPTNLHVMGVQHLQLLWLWYSRT